MCYSCYMSDTYDKPKSIKQFYRLWFEYVRLSLTEIRWTKGQKDYYSQWGDVLSYKNFDSWWKDKGHLFGDIRVERGSSRHPDTLNLKVPLTQSMKKSVDQIREILEEEIKGRLNEGRDKPLTPRELEGKLKLNHKKYPLLNQDKYRTLDDDLIIYRDVFVKSGKPKKLGDPFLVMVEEHFSKIKGRSKQYQKPDFLQTKSKGDNRLEQGDTEWIRQRDSEIRSLRRSLQRSRKTMESVRDGKFPPKN